MTGHHMTGLFKSFSTKCFLVRQRRAQNEQEKEGVHGNAHPSFSFSLIDPSPTLTTTLKVATHSKAHKDFRLANRNGQFLSMDL